MASSSNSNLADFGYDIVVGVIQSQINTFLKDLMLKPMPAKPLRLVYLQDKDQIRSVSWDEFTKRSNGIDPFDFSNGVIDPQALSNLIKADFIFAFEAQLSLPPGIRPDKNPYDLLDLVPGSAGSCVFTPLMRIFNVAFLEPLNHNFSYYTQKLRQPWLIQYTVNLNLQKMDSDQYRTLPPAIQNEINNLSGSAFEVQQLLFDLATLAPFSTPTFENVPPEIGNFLKNYFVKDYVQELKQKGLPLLGVAIVARTKEVSVFQPTDLTLWVNAYVDNNGNPIPSGQLTKHQKDCTTLNYVFVTNSKSLPSPQQMSWNWVNPNDSGDLPDHDGVVALALSDVIEWMKKNFEPLAQRSGYYWVDGQPDVSNHQFTFSFYPSSSSWSSNQWPATYPDYLTWKNSSVCGGQANGTATGWEMSYYAFYNYAAQLSWEGQTITFQQQMSLMLDVADETRRTSFTNVKVIDNTCTDTITIGVDASGALLYNVQNTDWTGFGGPGFIMPWTGFRDQPAVQALNDETAIDNMSELLRKFRSLVQTDNIFSDPNALKFPFFPGHQTFIFKNPRFSNTGDLLVNITYQNPE